MKFSAIIAYKPNDFYRKKNLAISRKRWEEKIPEVELIISTNNDEQFWKTKVINDAVKQATGDYFILADADIVFGSTLIDRIAAIATKHPWIIPWDTCYELSYQFSTQFYADDTFVLPKALTLGDLQPTTINYMNVKYLSNQYKNQYAVDGAYMNVISREAFAEIGGMDERFIGWGYEDLAMDAALKTLVGYPYRMDEPIFHLYHHRLLGCDYPHFKANEELWLRYQAALGDIAAMRGIIAEPGHSANI